MSFIEILKAIILGVVEGVTEWLPISSTGHLILVNEFLHLKMSKDFIDMFRVVIQLGAILAVVLLYWKKIFPFSFKKREDFIKKDIMIMWVKILVACVPAAIIGILWDDKIDALFYNYVSVSIALIVFGILFIVIENRNAKHRPRIKSIADITFQTTILIGIFQVIAAVFPGVSRSGATIIGAMLIGVARGVATEYTFFLAIPVMMGASLLKLVKFGSFTSSELIVLLTGMVTAFFVSIFVIKFLTGYIKKHNFKIFGWYRIVLGVIVLGFFVVQTYLF
jgi:undecaprenyl-diphosphatase UppP